MRFKHGHLCTVVADTAVAAFASVPAPAVKPCVRLGLDRPAAVAEPSGHEQLQRLLRAHDAGEALPPDALGRLIEALRVFAAHGELETQLNQFALEAGLTGDSEETALPAPAHAGRKAAAAAPLSHGGTTALDAARNLHCRALHVQTNMTRLGAALRETVGIVRRMRRTTLTLPEPRVSVEDDTTRGERRLVDA